MAASLVSAGVVAVASISTPARSPAASRTTMIRWTHISAAAESQRSRQSSPRFVVNDLRRSRRAYRLRRQRRLHSRLHSSTRVVLSLRHHGAGEPSRAARVKPCRQLWRDKRLTHHGRRLHGGCCHGHLRTRHHWAAVCRTDAARRARHHSRSQIGARVHSVVHRIHFYIVSAIIISSASSSSCSSSFTSWAARSTAASSP